MDDATLEEIFSALGPITIKRLFGGKGIYHQGLIVGALMDGEVLLKADAETEPQFLAAGSTQWVYEFKRGAKSPMPYWTIPPDALDDPDLLATWVHRALASARRLNAHKKGPGTGT